VSDDIVLRARGIRKSFGPVEVLRGVDFDVRAAEVHVLAGENGAGKSTLIKILSGVYQDHSGRIELDGVARRFRSPAEAARAGVSTIHQELALVPTMSVADNLFLGRERTDRWGRVDFAAQRRAARRVLEAARIDAAPDDEVARLPISSQQAIEIARALAGEVRLLILDEPTSALDEHEVAALFERLGALRESGCSIIYITHRMEEMYRLADRITVLRDGRAVGTAPAAELSPGELVALMVGREVEEETGSAVHRHIEAPALEVSNLCVPHPTRPGRNLVEPSSFVVGQGEIVGLAGLRGCGATDVLRAVFGALPRAAGGALWLHGEAFTPLSPADSIARGIALLSNDRKALGMLPDASVTHNASLSALRSFTGPGGWVDRAGERRAVRGVAERLALSAPSYEAPVRTLSGGNQQKVYLARCLLTRPRLLLLDEPTRGIDVAAKADIYRLLRNWAADGIGILLITSEISELLTLADRILVMYRGRIATELAGGEATKDDVLAAAMGATGEREAP
jgi:ABC-type sugar transport system ATPase subunit